MSHKPLHPLNRIAIVMIAYLIIGYAWAGAEILFYGETRPDWIDTIVGLILAIAVEPYLTKPRIIGVAKINGYYFDITGYDSDQEFIRITMGRNPYWIPMDACEEIYFPKIK